MTRAIKDAAWKRVSSGGGPIIHRVNENHGGVGACECEGEVVPGLTRGYRNQRRGPPALARAANPAASVHGVAHGDHAALCIAHDVHAREGRQVLGQGTRVPEPRITWR